MKRVAQREGVGARGRGRAHGLGLSSTQGGALRWWAQVAVALQRANADAVRASLGVVGGGQGVNHVEVPAAYELLLPVSGADL